MAALPVLTLDAAAKRVGVVGAGDTYVLPADTTVVGTIADSNTDLATVAAHITSAANPHSVTASQVNAVPNTALGAPLGVATLTAAGEVVEPVAGSTAAPVGAYLNSSGGWTVPQGVGLGDMLTATYDPQGIGSDVFAYAQAQAAAMAIALG